MESLFKENFIEINCNCKEDIYINAEEKARARID